MHLVKLIVEAVLAAYVVTEVVRFVPRYRRLKEAVATGDTHARTKMYREALFFEWLSALLAMAALGFDWSKLNPKALGLANLSAIQSLSSSGDAAHGAIFGVMIGVAAGTVGMIAMRLKAKKRGAGSSAETSAPSPWWRKLIPDFSALLPSTAQERWLWALVAVSAGICEEVLFRGWLLSVLHGQAGLSGITLIVAASAVFGLAHIYQRTTGVILTGLAGALFCVLYVVTGSLLIPIALHILVDARFAILPGQRIQKAQASESYA